MKRFVIKISILVLIVALSLWIISMSLAQAQSIDNDTSKFKSMPYDIMISNVGSSHGLYSFDYNNIDDPTCFNFALASQWPSYDYKLIKHYSDHLASGGILLIPISYFTFYLDEQKDKTYFYAKNQRYYNILPVSEIISGNYKSWFINKFFPILQANNKQALQRNLIEMNTVSAKNDAPLDDSALRSSAYAAYSRHVADNYVNGKLKVYEKEKQAVKDIIGFCRKKGITPILITTPFTDYYNQQATADFKKQFRKDLSDIINSTGVSYYDYSDDKRFSPNHELFLNSDHLNKKGALKFTDIVYKEIAKPILKENIS